MVKHSIPLPRSHSGTSELGDDDRFSVQPAMLNVVRGH